MKKTEVLSENQKSYIKAIVIESAPYYADTAVKRAFVSAVSLRETDKKKIFRETEDLLRAKEILEENIIENQEKLKSIEIGIKNKTTASDIVCMAQNRLTEQQMIDSKCLHLQSKIEKDKLYLDLLEKALTKVKDDNWYKVIEYKYWLDMDDFDIADKFNCDVRTVRRHKNRLVWRMSVKIAGSEIL